MPSITWENADGRGTMPGVVDTAGTNTSYTMHNRSRYKRVAARKEEAAEEKLGGWGFWLDPAQPDQTRPGP